MSKPASKGSRSGAVKRVQDYIDKGEFEAELRPARGDQDREPEVPRSGRDRRVPPLPRRAR